jgi:hypothetical protein
MDRWVAFMFVCLCTCLCVCRYVYSYTQSTHRYTHVHIHGGITWIPGRFLSHHEIKHEFDLLTSWFKQAFLIWWVITLPDLVIHNLQSSQSHRSMSECHSCVSVCSYVSYVCVYVYIIIFTHVHVHTHKHIYTYIGAITWMPGWPLTHHAFTMTLNSWLSWLWQGSLLGEWILSLAQSYRISKTLRHISFK